MILRTRVRKPTNNIPPTILCIILTWPCYSSSSPATTIGFGPLGRLLPIREIMRWGPPRQCKASKNFFCFFKNSKYRVFVHFPPQNTMKICEKKLQKVLVPAGPRGGPTPPLCTKPIPTSYPAPLCARRQSQHTLVGPH